VPAVSLSPLPDAPASTRSAAPTSPEQSSPWLVGVALLAAAAVFAATVVVGFVAFSLLPFRWALGKARGEASRTTE
jgi:hypothetical protein